VTILLSLLSIFSMTAFTTANIPSNVNTLEEVFAWAASALAELNPNVLVQTSTGAVEPVCTAQTYRFPNQDTDPERYVIVAYLPLASGWRGAGKVWSTGIKEISQSAIPAGFTAN
jgi:hypothetical protein